MAGRLAGRRALVTGVSSGIGAACARLFLREGVRVAGLDAGKPPLELGRIEEAHALGRLGEPEEMANVALFLACDEASFVSGGSLTVDGGFHAGKRFGISAQVMEAVRAASPA